MVQAVSVHLLLNPSGELSRDVLALEDFGSWNFHPLSKDLPQDQRFTEFLIKVRLSSTGETFRKGTVGAIEVRSKNRKALVARVSLKDIYVGPERETVTALLVRDRVCEPLIVTVVADKSRLARELPFKCGE